MWAALRRSAVESRFEVLHASGLIVLTLTGDQISMITRFDNSVINRFGLPRSLPA